MGKIFTVRLPDIGEGVVEGEVIQWLKQENDWVQQDEPVVIVMTDKATVELPAPHPGKVSKHYFKVGEIAIKDKPLYDIEVEESLSISSQEPVEEIVKKVMKEPKVEKAHSEAVLALPSTRKLAKQLQIDMGQIAGSGKEGRITPEDLIKSRALPKLPRLPTDYEVPVTGIRNLMAKKMVESNNQIPHFSYFEQIDASRLVQLRQHYKEEAAKQNIHVTYMPFIIRALSLTLNKFPEVNSSFDAAENKLIVHASHHVGIAMTTNLGLIVPVLKDVQRMTLNEIIFAYEELKTRAEKGKLQSHEMKVSTITISNFGVLAGGGLWATPIINYPEAAILGVARIHKQPYVRNEEIVIRDVLNFSWSFDHRIVDGDLAATFSHYFATLLQNPAPLL
jgi:pyruvate dehydrogenase E2 component (dihydrolipoamide acetyltransferase)